MQLLLNLLWSLNERIVGRPGADFEPPSLQWLGDVAAVDQATAEQIREIRKQSKKKMKRDAAEARRAAEFERGYQ